MSFQADSGGGAVGQGIMAAGAAAFAAGGMNIQAVKAVTDETQKLVNAAKSGGFKITAAGVEPLRKALNDMATKLDSLKGKTQVLSQAPQLGSHPYGHTVAAHDQKGAAEAAGSAQQVLQQFSSVLKQADEALARAAGLYKETEQRAADLSKSVKTLEA
ncbi:hypothetical protein [Amycolatopsis sp. NPDC059021]|uniref:hypothetical protein n=1 Tax=Amycolatopsis sp. NPDC059021 TaxID=3346704 RepID=UPI0036710853